MGITYPVIRIILWSDHSIKSMHVRRLNMADNNESTILRSDGEKEYESIEDGVYLLGSSHVFGEATLYDKTKWTRLYVDRIRLPQNNGNIIYLLSDDFESSLKLTNLRTVIFPSNYRSLFIPHLYNGVYCGKRLRVDNAKTRIAKLAKIKEMTKLRPYPGKVLVKQNTNVVFDTSDIYNRMKFIGDKLPPRKIIYGFFNDFKRVLDSMTPTSFAKRICIIDVSSFKFVHGAPLAANKNNPLFILYTALFKTRDNSVLNLDMDFIIASDKMFMKFNPANLTKASFVQFKTALFRIMGSDVDEYIDKLPPEEKEAVTITDEASISKPVVDKVANAFTQYSSPEIKSVVSTTVNSQVKYNTQKNLNTAEIIDRTKKEVSASLSGKGLTQPKKIDYKQMTSERKRANLFKAALGDDYEPLFTDYEYDVEENEDIPEGDESDEIVFGPEENEDVSDEEEVADYVDQEAIDILTKDKKVAEEIEDAIQDNKVPLSSARNSPVNSALDQKLREDQKKVVVQGSTIEEILARDSSDTKIKSDDHSAAMHTTNENVKTVAFNNFDKTYIEELYTKDILNCFNCLNDKTYPFYIIGVKIEDSSDALNLKDTWYVTLMDDQQKKHEIVVDIPKFYENRFIYIKGIKRMILKQNAYMPVVKDTPNTVLVTTDYKGRINISRKDTKSFTDVERLFSLMNKLPDSDNTFVVGDSATGNMKNMRFISTLEYDEIAKSIYSFKTPKCQIYFSREYIKETFEDPTGMKGNEFLIGFENKQPLMINHQTGLDRNGRNIIGIIRDNLSDEQRAIFDSIKPLKTTIYASGRIFDEEIPVVIILLIWEGFRGTLDKMGVEWKFIEGARIQKDPNKMYIKFKDGYFECENTIFAQLMLNGLNKIKANLFTFQQMDTEECYIDYLKAQYGKYAIKNAFITFKEFMMDPIAIEVCRDVSLPTDASGLLIHAVKLLSDNSYLNKASDKMYRVRSCETVAAVLYAAIGAQYARHASSYGKVKMTIPRDAVITALLQVPIVENYSTINPSTEVGKMSAISSKGFRGSNKPRNYTEDKRSYDESSIGKIAMETTDDANVGINRKLVVEPTIDNARGYRKPVEDISELKDVNIFSPVELLTPGTVSRDDPVRSSIAAKQTRHITPIVKSSPALVSNGYDEAIQYHLSSDFVVIAEEDGEVVEVDEKLGFIVVRYASGKHRAINVAPTIVQNGGGGFFLSNVLVGNVTMGEKFKKDYVLAYHTNYFTYSKMNGLRHNIGALVKMAYLSSSDTYEDAGICTKKMSKDIATEIVFKQQKDLQKNSNIVYMVKIGDHVKVGDPLIQFDTAFQDADINKFMSKLDEDEQEIAMDNTNNTLPSKHAGEIVDIRVYSLHDPSQLSENLGKVVKQYWLKGEKKEKLLNKYDASPGILKAGHLLLDSTEPVVSRYGEIKGSKTDVKIEFYISHVDEAGIGDKIVLYGPNKQIISSVVPEGYEPFSEFRPDEEISVITSPGTVARRMVTSVIPVSAAMKIMVELKRKVKDMML
jgi:hypothetical protein